MIPIPRSALPHNIVLRAPGQTDAWDGETERSAGTEIRYVRIEPSSKLVSDTQNGQIQLSALLFYDCTNSTPRGISWKQGQKITFNGQPMTVQVVEPLYAAQALHHYEIGLV
ncbi:MAG: hypothetical protein KIC46_04850 [Clostridiales bacterium]|nr:hypothetical protein [Clostridiales bacterium]